jgi:hypothetical protein
LTEHVPQVLRQNGRQGSSGTHLVWHGSVAWTYVALKDM